MIDLYRFRATFRGRWRGYAAMVLLTGLLGGVAIGSLAAARRTQSSYPRYLARTNPSDLILQPSTTLSDLPAFVAEVARLPHVKTVRTLISVNAHTISPTGGLGTLLLTKAELVASSDGLYADQDRVTLLNGRRPDPTREDEVLVSPTAASLLAVHVGSQLPVGIDANDQQSSSQAYRTTRLTVVGVGLFNTQLVQDDIDRGRTGLILGTPALVRSFSSCCIGVNYLNLQLTGGSRDDALVEAEYAHLVATSPLAGADHSQLLYYITSATVAAAERAIRPESVALGVFGLVAALTTLLVGIQLVSRQLNADADDLRILRALGAGPGTTTTGGIVGTVAELVLGSLLAAAIGVGLSPLTRFGPARVVEPASRVVFDWTVLGAGVLVLIVGLGSAAAVLAYRRAPHRPSRRRPGQSMAVQAAVASGVPPAGLAGVRFALDPGQGRSGVPVRSAILGAVLAVVIVVATLTFGASLDTMLSHPELYGWNFDAALYSTDGFGPLPTVITGPLLAHDQSVAATTGVYFGSFAIDGQAVPGIVGPTKPAVAPPLLSGHGLDGAEQILLGPGTLARLHKRVGDSVVVEGNGLEPVHLQIVGTVALPAVGETAGVHASMSTGAFFSTDVVPAPLLQNYGPDSGPNAIFVRFGAGVDRTAGRRSLEQIAAQLNDEFHSPAAVAASGGASSGAEVEVLGVQRPAEIVTSLAMGRTPQLLAAAFAAGVVLALALTLAASVRRRRRDLALLKTLGFTTRQVAAAIASQATVIAVIGLVVGVPTGIALGRWLWLRFANELSAIPQPTVPSIPIVLAAVGALLLANVVAALPARSAARTPVALALRAE